MNHLPRRAFFAALAGLGLMGLRSRKADAVPSTFTDGTVISAAQMNANFADMQAQINALVPPGTVVPFAGGVTPPGWLLCDGAALDRTAYAALFGAIGTAWGAPDAATFNLPDLRGRFLRGVDHGATQDPDAATRGPSKANGNAGDAVGSVQGDDFKGHSHTNPPEGGFIINGTTTVQVAGYTGGTSGIFNMSYATGSSGGWETRPRNAAVNYIIKY